MLYATTRSDRDVFTVQRALTEKTAPDGGFYVPFRETRFTREQLEISEQSSQQENMAQLLSLMFKTRLTAWDLEFTAGRKPLRVEKIGRRIAVGERWHNTGGEFSCLVQNLTERLCSQDALPGEPGIWAETACSIASLFALFALMRQQGYRQEDAPVDLAAEEGNLLTVVSGWFARSWGLPIGKILCGCRENGVLWELTHTGELRTQGLTERSCYPGLEMLIYCCGGRWETERLQDACFAELPYKPGDNTLRRLHQGLGVSVVSDRRIMTVIPSVYSAHGYILHPRAVLPYAGLLDDRARTGAGSWGLVIADQDPARDCTAVAAALGITEQAARDRLKNR